VVLTPDHSKDKQLNNLSLNQYKKFSHFFIQIFSAKRNRILLIEEFFIQISIMG
jgi:hypothetical protein